MVKLTATDEQGRTAVFSLRRGVDNKGYMVNESIVENGRISADAKRVTVTLSALELPEEKGFVRNDYVQIGEPVTWDMADLTGQNSH